MIKIVKTSLQLEGTFKKSSDFHIFFAFYSVDLIYV
jgi:hypothetical protein